MMTTINLNEIRSANIDPESINNMEIVKQKILDIIDKYLPEEDRSIRTDTRAWDIPNQISIDIGEISAYMSNLAPIIGFIEGLVTVAEEEKKIAMAEAMMNAKGMDPETNKPKTDTTCKNEARITCSSQIDNLSRVAALSTTYRAFQFQINRLIDTLHNRLKIIALEISNVI